MFGSIGPQQHRWHFVTLEIQPFIFVSAPLDATDPCPTSKVCLRINSTDKQVIDKTFEDFRKGLNKETYYVYCCSGMSISFIEQMSKTLGFQYDLYIVADGQYGKLDNGTWTGMIGDVVSGAADMAIAPLTITEARSRVVDFSDPYFYAGYSIMVANRERETLIYAFLEPLHWMTWMLTAVSATVTAFAVSLMEWNSPYGLNPWGRKRKQNYTLGSGVNMVWAVLFGHTVKTKSPKSWPAKWLQNFWAFASIFFIAIYTAHLAAFLAGKQTELNISGVNDSKVSKTSGLTVLGSKPA